MSQRSIYLAKYRRSSNERYHFALFIPNAACDIPHLSQTFRTSPCLGTIIHVVGEPMMAGFALEIKRNYDCGPSQDLQALVHLGYVDSSHVFSPATPTFVKGDIPRARLDQEATRVPPPPKGQNLRAPIDGVNTKRCQEWTMEYLQRLVSIGLIGPSAVEIAQSHRDSPTHGIFGMRAAGPAAGLLGR